MKQLVILAGCSVLLLLGSCQNAGSDYGGIEGGRKFPVFPAGTWQAEDSPWRIVLDPNGTVSSVLVLMGEAVVRPNQTTSFEMQDGTFSHITGGEFFADYEPATRELSVVVEQSEIYIPFPEDSVDGNSIDYFKGRISEDGKTWNAEWITVFDWGPHFPQDENDIYPQPLIFKKVEENNKSEQ